jgi:bacterioferritin-associated ferredoxin
MIVCNCNRLNDRDIDAAIRAGAARAPDVYRHHGCEVRCGACVNDICEKLATRGAAPAPAVRLPVLAKA